MRLHAADAFISVAAHCHESADEGNKEKEENNSLNIFIIPDYHQDFGF